MSGFFNFLKNLFSGLLGLVGLGSKKAELGAANPPKPRRSGYFLELEDAKGSLTPPAKPIEVAKSIEKPTPVAVAAQPPAKKEQPAKADPAQNPVQNPVTVAQALNLPEPKVTNFATTYLAPGNGSVGRRRPGANMNAYLDMAKQAKVPG